MRTLSILERIFFCIFFTAMMVTAFNYLPVIEEEVCSKKYEQCQKQDSPDDEEPVSEDENGPGHEDFFSVPGEVAIGGHEVPRERLRAPNDRFYPPLPRTCMVPPRLAA